MLLVVHQPFIVLLIVKVLCVVLPLILWLFDMLVIVVLQYRNLLDMVYPVVANVARPKSMGLSRNRDNISLQQHDTRQY